MTQDDARSAILSAFQKWKSDHHAGGNTVAVHQALLFYGWLSRERPDLLSFRASGDTWQRVKSWLMNAGLIDDVT